MPCWHIITSSAFFFFLLKSNSLTKQVQIAYTRNIIRPIFIRAFFSPSSKHVCETRLPLQLIQLIDELGLFLGKFTQRSITKPQSRGTFVVFFTALTTTWESISKITYVAWYLATKSNASFRLIASPKVASKEPLWDRAAAPTTLPSDRRRSSP
jgi:hypothetical protein